MIQTRVAEELERRLKHEAEKRRLTVSHLIRNTLEDAFHLVENVTNDVEQLVTGSVELAAAVGRDARRLASIVRGVPADSAPPETADAAPEPVTEALAQEHPDPLAHIYGWNRVIANRPASCARCDATIERGDDAMVGLSDDAAKPRAWLCAGCAERL